jgi:hypothetical protein
VTQQAASPGLPSLTTHRVAEQRAIHRLATMVGEVATGLSAAAGALSPDAVTECNAALEGYLEGLRDARGADDAPGAMAVELARLARLLTIVDRADAPLVVRMIRRVLARLDVGS